MKKETLIRKIYETKSLLYSNGDAGINRTYFSMLTVVQRVYGATGPHVAHLEKVKEEYDLVKSDGEPERQSLMWQALSDLLDEFERDVGNGLLDSVQLLATGEVLADLVTLAKENLATSKDVAAVLISAAFEDAVGSSRVDLQACKLEYSIVSPK